MTVHSEEQDGATVVVVTPDASPADQSDGSSLISEIVEARVDAQRADENATDALETAERVEERQEEQTQWTNERLNNLEQSMFQMGERLENQMLTLQSTLSELIQPPHSDQSAEELLNSTESLTTEAEALASATVEAMAENPELTNTSETLTEASSETQTEVLDASGEENPEPVAVVAAVVVQPVKRVRYT
jgi:methyl-accepting chemotaxis protein